MNTKILLDTLTMLCRTHRLTQLTLAASSEGVVVTAVSHSGTGQLSVRKESTHYMDRNNPDVIADFATVIKAAQQ